MSAPVRTDSQGTDSPNGHVGSHSVEGKAVHKAPLGWLPWAALLLLGLLGLAAFLIARNVGDAGDNAGVDVTDERSAPGQDPAGPDANRGDGPDSGSGRDASRATAAPAASGNAGATTPTAGAAAPSAGSAASGSLTAGGQPILPLPAAGLGSLTGRPVEGLNVRVESVVGDEAFWVGDSATNRVLVFLTPQARTRNGESPFQVRRPANSGHRRPQAAPQRHHALRRRCQGGRRPAPAAGPVRRGHQHHFELTSGLGGG